MTKKEFVREDIKEFISTGKLGTMFSSNVEFSEYIEMLANFRQESLLDTLTYYTESVGCEYDYVAKLITENLKMKLKNELEDTGLLASNFSAQDRFTISF